MQGGGGGGCGTASSAESTQPQHGPLVVVSSAAYLHALLTHLIVHHRALSAGSARFTLTPSAMTVLARRREELQQVMSDREARARGDARRTVGGMSVENLNKLFVMLASLVSYQSSAPRRIS
jgi:hypothetical protein